jgi:hypothetical protein
MPREKYPQADSGSGHHAGLSRCSSSDGEKNAGLRLAGRGKRMLKKSVKRFFNHDEKCAGSMGLAHKDCSRIPV